MPQSVYLITCSLPLLAYYSLIYFLNQFYFVSLYKSLEVDEDIGILTHRSLATLNLDTHERENKKFAIS